MVQMRPSLAGENLAEGLTTRFSRKHKLKFDRVLRQLTTAKPPTNEKSFDRVAGRYLREIAKLGFVLSTRRVDDALNTRCYSYHCEFFRTVEDERMALCRLVLHHPRAKMPSWWAMFSESLIIDRRSVHLLVKRLHAQNLVSCPISK